MKLKDLFDEEFKTWGISLPETDAQLRRKGTIHKSGWTINFRFGRENGVEFLEYFASHRMTNDTLNRIYEDGDKQMVGFSREFYRVDDPKDKRNYIEHNRHFYDEVKYRGLF